MVAMLVITVFLVGITIERRKELMIKNLLNDKNFIISMLNWFIALIFIFLPGEIFKWTSIVLFITAAINLYIGIKTVQSV